MSLQKSFLYTLVALALGAVVATAVTSGTVLSLFTQATIYAVFAIGVGLLLRQNGMVSFGHALFYGSAGYGVGLLLQMHWFSAGTAILVTLGSLALAAFVMGLVMVRVPGVAFGMLTLAVGQMFYLTASRTRGLTGGADGMNIDWPQRLFGASLAQLTTPSAMFLLCWTTLVLVLLLLSLLLRSRFGSITEAVRDNE